MTLLLVRPGISQNLAESTSYSIQRATQPIVVDGKLDEAVWESLPSGSGFTQNFPSDSTAPYFPTEFKFTYDDQFIYVALICFEGEGKPISQSLRRDFMWFQNDNAGLYLDPFDDKTNGFTFQVTPYNVQREGLVTLGGEVSDDWDNKWFSATQILEDRWVAEMAIPFKSIRYNSIPAWGLQLIRNNRRQNERSSWIQVPQQYRTSDLIYTGRLIWDVPPPEAGTNLSVIPYVTAGASKDFEEDTPRDQNLEAGFDAKIGVTNSLNLDLTVNPDFSQVEVDRQVTNLNRFEIFFPERRQFFLENQDLFARNGFPDARPFFSRRIGIATNDDDETVQVPILAGARLSGKMGKNWRLGVLNMQTQKESSINEPAQNYTVGILQRQLFGRNNVSAIVVNREATNFDESDTTINSTRFNRVFGVDYNLASLDNRWEGNFFYHNSEDPGSENNSWSHGGFLGYNTRNVNVFWFHMGIGDNYNAEVGFVPRTGIFNYGAGAGYTFYTAGKVQRHGPFMEFERVATDGLTNLDLRGFANYELNFLNTSNLEVFGVYNEVTLEDAFDPSNSDGVELPAGGLYRWSRIGVFYQSDTRTLLNVRGSVSYGGFYNGNRLRVRSTLNYRYQPFISFAMNFEFNNLEFPEPYNSTEFFLVSPRVDLTLSTQLFFTTFVQYNSQEDNLNINSRLQWRFQPVSDLFLVYTDNYFTTDEFDDMNSEAFNLSPRNRAIVLKLSYWLNI